MHNALQEIALNLANKPTPRIPEAIQKSNTAFTF